MTTTQISVDIRASELAEAHPQQRQALATALQSDLRSLKVYPASISGLYRALQRGDLAAFTVPAFNIRGLTYELARAIWRAAMQAQVGALIFELAPSESAVGEQSFEEYAAWVLAAAAREGYRGPVFLQGDHFEVHSAAEMGEISQLAKRAVQAGFYQIDIDASHLFNPNSADLSGFHSPNANATAELITTLRASQPQSVHLTLGGEVGEIGGKNTSRADLQAFYQELTHCLPAGVAGLDKISAQTGTMHGGNIQPDGSLARMPVDFALAADLSSAARALGIAGLVQHGASTLAFTDLERLPPQGVIEVHLATQIQNIVFDHPAFPPALLNKIREQLLQPTRGAEGEQLPSAQESSAAQQFYRARWAAWGPFKQDLLALPPDALQPITASLSTWAAQIFQALQVEDSAAVTRQFSGEVA